MNLNSHTQNRAYASPVLTRLGMLCELTAAGSNQILTEQGNPGNCSQDANRTVCRQVAGG